MEGGFPNHALAKPCSDFVKGRGERDGSQEGSDQFSGPLSNNPFNWVQGVAPMITFHQFISMHVFGWFPRVVCRRITLPFDQILELVSTPVMPVVHNRFDFVLFYVLN